MWKNVAMIAVCGDFDIKMAEPAIDPFRRLVQAETNILKWGDSLPRSLLEGCRQGLTASMR